MRFDSTLVVLPNFVVQGAESHPRDLSQVCNVVVQPDELMHHGLVGPLHEEWGHRVLLAVQYEHEGSCLCHRPAAKVKELPLVDRRQVVEGLCQLLARL